MCDWKKKLIEDMEMELTELIATSGWWKQDIHTDFKAYTAGVVHAWVGQKYLNCTILKSFCLAVIAS